MKIEIDLTKDSEEDLKVAIGLLEEALKRKGGSRKAPTSDFPIPAESSSAFGGLFGMPQNDAGKKPDDDKSDDEKSGDEKSAQLETY